MMEFWLHPLVVKLNIICIYIKIFTNRVDPNPTIFLTTNIIYINKDRNEIKSLPSC